MKKSFLIVGALSAILSTNGYAVGSQDVVVEYYCPAGCELHFTNYSAGVTTAYCVGPNGEECDDPTVGIEVDNAISPVTPVVNPTALKPNKTDKVNAKKSKKVSARAAEIPKMVKKIVYEQVVEEDEE